MIRVASYCRVSTDHEDQANSFASQRQYFQEYIARHPGWELYEIYADEGITGTSTNKRSGFLKMIRDAREGRFQLILTKEISRFSRNILDTITYTRKLKEMGVGVLFMTENLNTMDQEAEMLLTFMGTIAQEESRRTSVRVKWGQTRRMEQGVVFGPPLLGYNVKNGTLMEEPEGAELVRLIFHKYGVENKGTSVICKELKEAGFRTSNGNSNWSAGQIIKILKNEKYVGDLVQKKTITPDYLSHKKKKNRGEEQMVILRDHHKGIIDRALWDTVQEELERRNKHREREGRGSSVRYALSGKIKCGECGSVFVCRSKRRKDGSRLHRWGCSKSVSEGCRRSVDEKGDILGCDVGWLLRDDVAMGLVGQALASLEMDRISMSRRAAEIVSEAALSGAEGLEKGFRRTEAELARLEKKKIRALDAYLSGEIREAELAQIRAQYEEQAVELQNRQEELRSQTEKQSEITGKAEQEVMDLLTGRKLSEALCRTLVREITVFRARYVELSFCGLAQTFVFEESDKGMD